MTSQDTQVPTTVLFPPAAVALARMSAVTLLATFGLCIFFLVAAISLAPGTLRTALAAPGPVAQELAAQDLAATHLAELRR